MKKVKGDLIHLAMDGHFDVIIHGCNCFHTMGAGVAKTIAQRFPEAYEADKQTSYGERSKLGTISTATITRGAVSFVVVNAYTQFDWRGRGRRADYDAISGCFEDVARRFLKSRIGYPLIGAGLARGDWAQIAPRIEAALDGLDHTLVEYSG
ncbi:macro domain-containing protein [Ruegeria sp. SCPT10]|uniref:macro domain-containing protein n=1 Tax=Ruegeria sp. SCP10 TaxID=3141377 RepID=UPI003339D74F